MQIKLLPKIIKDPPSIPPDLPNTHRFEQIKPKFIVAVASALVRMKLTDNFTDWMFYRHTNRVFICRKIWLNFSLEWVCKSKSILVIYHSNAKRSTLFYSVQSHEALHRIPRNSIQRKEFEWTIFFCFGVLKSQ